jgi:hypothetical protein
MKRKNLKLALCAAAAAAALFLSACDMVLIKDLQSLQPDKELTEDERNELEKNGHFLKLTGMPLNAQASNVFSVQVANSFSPVGKLNKNNTIYIYRENDSLTSTLYLPLVYNDDSDFLESGSFYTAFAIHVDAIRKYVVDLSDRLLVEYIEGRGSFNVGDLPNSGPDDNRELTEEERIEFDRNGHYLKLTGLPSNTQITNIFLVQIANSLSPIGKLNKNNTVYIYRENDSFTSTVYLPLVYNDNNDFLETGSFYASFSVHVDAVNKYVVDLSDKLLVQFTEGRGTFDIRNISFLNSGRDVELSEVEKETLENNGRYLKLTGLPLNAQTANFYSVQISNSMSVVGKLNKNKTIHIYRENNSSTVYLPLVYNDESDFIETGSFFTAFTVHVDAVNKFVVDLSDKILVQFTEGRGAFDVGNVPSPDLKENFLFTENERDDYENNGRYLKLTCLPPNTHANNVFSVLIANSSSQIAKLDKNNPVYVYKEKDFTSTVYLPLVYNNDRDFIETGSFYAAFTVHVDAVNKYAVDLSDKILVQFTEGRGTFDVRNIPSVSSAELRYLTVVNLPSGFVAQGVSQVNVHNMYSPVASCQDYSLVEVSASGGSASVKIPLHFIDSQDSVFTSSGSFFVSFDLYFDAVTHYTVSFQDRVSVNFINGNGFLDINNLTADNVPYLSIIGLPVNTTNKHFSNVSVYNKTGSVASCGNINNIAIVKYPTHSTALIPLSYRGNDYFRDTGVFIITFTVNIDALTQISYSREDSLMLNFFNGSASFDYLTALGFFSGELVNPNDLEPPVIKNGSSFDVNGSIYRASDDIVIDSFITSYNCVTYLYAYRVENEVFFEYSSVTPVFNSSKKGYYNGNKRALWKMLLLTVPPANPLDSPQNFFLFKKYIYDEWSHLDYFVINNQFLINSLKGTAPVYSLSGENNPTPASVTLEPGIYMVSLTGAGGGSSYYHNVNSVVINPDLNNKYYILNSFTTYPNNRSRSNNVFSPDNYLPLAEAVQGGDGGTVTEILVVTSATTFTSFTGSGGTSSSKSNQENDPPLLSSGGGGGGSGAFLYSAQGYFLCAGGGAGAPGISSLSPAGGGGLGGSIGPGGGGGGSGHLIEFISIESANSFFNSIYLPHGLPPLPLYLNDFLVNNNAKINTISNIFFTTYSVGGYGGGYGGGLGGLSDSSPNPKNGTNGISILPATSFLHPNTNSSSLNPYRNNQIDYKYSLMSYNITDTVIIFDPSYPDDIHQIYFTLNFNSASYQLTPSGSGGSAYHIPDSSIFNTNNANGMPEMTPALPSSVLLFSELYNIYTNNFSFAKKTDQRNGGNNRNSLRGGGANGGSKITYSHSLDYNNENIYSRTSPNGEAGSITIYKIQ